MQAERSQVFRPESKTDPIGAQTETALATIAAPNPMPHASPPGFKNEAPGAHALGALTQN